MHHAVADEFRVLEPGDQLQYPRLFAPLQLSLEAHEAVVITGEVVLPELNDRVRSAPGARLDEADRLHRTKAQRIPTAMRHHFDREATFEKPLLVEIMNNCRLCCDESAEEPIVFFLRERAVQIIAFTTVRAARLPGESSGVRWRFCGPQRKLVGLVDRLRKFRSANAAVPARRAEDFAPIDRLGENDGTDRIVEIQI